MESGLGLFPGSTEISFPEISHDAGFIFFSLPTLTGVLAFSRMARHVMANRLSIGG
ncbi:hypothetical protein IHE61_26100 [Streptomyces sp. GKU 257-1]|nr:hypothetical protein [Streptomyces sp. GKU 257-1]